MHFDQTLNVTFCAKIKNLIRFGALEVINCRMQIAMVSSKMAKKRTNLPYRCCIFSLQSTKTRKMIESVNHKSLQNSNKAKPVVFVSF